MEKEVTILTYVDHSFEQDLTFIDGLVKTRSRSFLSDSSALELEKVLSKYMIILWSLEAYPESFVYGPKYVTSKTGHSTVGSYEG